MYEFEQESLSGGKSLDEELEHLRTCASDHLEKKAALKINAAWLARWAPGRCVGARRAARDSSGFCPASSVLDPVSSLHVGIRPASGRARRHVQYRDSRWCRSFVAHQRQSQAAASVATSTRRISDRSRGRIANTRLASSRSMHDEPTHFTRHFSSVKAATFGACRSSCGSQ